MPEPGSEVLRFVEEAGFVFRGKVAHKRTAAVQGAPSSGAQPATTTVHVEEVLRSTEVLRGLAGRDVTLAGEHVGRLEDEGSYVFFTNCVVLGDHAVVRDIGHVRATREVSREVAEALKDAGERPLRERIAAAELIVEGHVTESRKADPDAVQKSEHDPNWWIARVAVDSTLKGGKAAHKSVEVLFANSKDIAWFKSPKLHEGARGILLLHHLKEGDAAPRGVERTVYQATDPLDLLPAERLADVKRMIPNPDKGGR